VVVGVGGMAGVGFREAGGVVVSWRRSLVAGWSSSVSCRIVGKLALVAETEKKGKFRI